MKNYKKHQNNDGYVILLALVIMGLLGLIFLSSINVLSSTSNYLETLKIEKQSKQNSNIKASIYKKISDDNNAGSVTTDTIGCDGELIIDESDNVSCNTAPPELPALPASVDYTLDNNNYKCDYIDDYAKIDPSSTKKCDNDDIHRKIITGIISKDEIQTAFFINDKALDIIENNINNSGSNIVPVLPRSGASFNNFYLNINITSGSENDLDMILYTASKTKFNEKGEINIIDKKLTKSGIESTLLDIENNDYYLKFENTGNNIITYEISAQDEASGEEIYIVPIDDTNSANQILLTGNLLNLSGDFIYFDEEKYYATSN